MEKIKFIATEKVDLEKTLRKKLPLLSNYQIEKLFKDKDVKVNGVRKTKTCILKIGDEVEAFYMVNDQPWCETVFEDNNVLVVNKRAGIEVISEEDRNLLDILKIKHDEINNFSFEKNTITRILCSVTIEFRQLYIKTEISDGLTDAPMSLVPVAKDLVIIKQVKADSPVLDFSYGGGGETTKTSNSRHAHTNNSDCGFAFAVFHPGTGVPLGNPWKN